MAVSGKGAEGLDLAATAMARAAAADARKKHEEETAAEVEAADKPPP